MVSRGDDLGVGFRFKAPVLAEVRWNFGSFRSDGFLMDLLVGLFTNRRYERGADDRLGHPLGSRFRYVSFCVRCADRLFFLSGRSALDDFADGFNGVGEPGLLAWARFFMR